VKLKRDSSVGVDMSTVFVGHPTKQPKPRCVWDKHFQMYVCCSHGTRMGIGKTPFAAYVSWRRWNSEL
jgi:hypothetical protein